MIGLFKVGHNERYKRQSQTLPLPQGFRDFSTWVLLHINCYTFLKVVSYGIIVSSMHQCHFIDILLRKQRKIPFKTAKEMNNHLDHHLDPGLEPVDKGHLLSSVVLGYFLGTYEECSRFYSMGTHGVKCKLLETEIKNCKDKEFFKFSTCNKFISLTMICFIAGMLSFGLLQNQSVGVQ